MYFWPLESARVAPGAINKANLFPILTPCFLAKSPKKLSSWISKGYSVCPLNNLSWENIAGSPATIVNISALDNV